MKYFTISIVFILFISFVNNINAQFIQQGDKLVGTGYSEFSRQGYSVAISGDGNTAIVGGSYDISQNASAWVYVKNGGSWSQQAVLFTTVSDFGLWDYEGHSVSISADGNTVVVGDPYDNNGVGAAWIFVRQNGQWTQQGSKLVGSDVIGNAYLGHSVSLSADGNTVIVGGSNDQNDTDTYRGAAWIFVRQNGQWTQQGPKLVGSGATGGNACQGNSVSLSADGNTAIVGGHFDYNGTCYTGAAWIFIRQNGQWTQQGSKLVGSGNIGQSWQGYSVSLSADGNTAIVGGSMDNDAIGAAWIFVRQNGQWTQQGTKLVGSGNIGQSCQGSSVSLSADGNTAIVGGHFDDFFGAAWIFVRQNGQWAQQGSKLVGSGATIYDYQGYSVSLSADGKTAIVGGPNNNNRIGAAWIFVYSTHSIISAAGEGGTISPSGNVTVNYGSNQSFTITPNSGYHVLDVIVDNQSKGAQTSYTFTNVTGNHTISAQFEMDIPEELPVPVAVSPKGGVILYTNTPTLYWSVEGNTTGLSFRIKYSTDPNNSNQNGDLKIADAGSSTSYALPQLQWGKTYYWQVQSVKGSASSDYSAIESFKVVEEQVVVNPEVPIPAWPLSGSTVYLSSTTLTWYMLSGWSNIVSYTLRWGESGGSLNNVVDGITSVTYPITGLLPGHTYSWRVESVDRQNHHSLPSDVQSFTTAGGTSNKPYTPTQAWPVGGAIVYVTSPTLSWYMLQPGFGIKEYLIRYSKNPDMSQSVEIHLSGLLNVITLTGLEKGMTYYWQVQAHDGYVYSEPQTPPESFTVYTDWLTAGYTPMALSPSGGIVLSTSSVQLSWASLSKGESQSYNLQYSTNKDFTNPVEVKHISDPYFKTDKLNNSTYYWRVQSQIQGGITSSYSPAGKFTVKTVTGVMSDNLNAHEFSLLQNYPNPFNPTTSIVFNLPKESDVTVEVFDGIGKFVSQLFKGPKPKGITTLEFNAEDLPSGIYFYKIIALDTNGNMNYAIKKMIILK